MTSRAFQLCFLSAVCLLLCQTGAARADEGKTAPSAGASPVVKVGVILPLSGDAAYWGTNPKQAMELAIGDIAKTNANASRIQFIYEDDHCDPKTAVSSFQKLVDVDHVKVIIGPSCSSCVAALAPLVRDRDVLLVVFAEASIAEVGKHILRLWIPSSRQAERMATYLGEERKFKRVAVLAIENAFGEDTGSAFGKKFEALGGTVTGIEHYDSKSSDFKPVLLKLLAAKPDALYLISYIADGATAVRQLKELGKTVPLFGASTVNSLDFFNAVGDRADGMILADVPDHTPNEFRDRWKSVYHADYPGLQSGAPIFYDFTHLLVDGIEALENASNFRAFLLQHAAYRGVFGTLKFDESGNLTLRHEMLEVRGRTTTEMIVPK